MKIAQILSSFETSVTGLFTATPKGRPVSQNGRHGRYVELADETGRMLVLAAEGSYAGPELTARTGTLICADLDILAQGRARVALLRKAHEHDITSDLAFGQTYDLSRRTQNLIDRLTFDPLKNFVRSVFSNPEIAVPFTTLPASWCHHHNYRTGLHEHSLEVAEIVAGARKNAPLVHECGIVGAFFHDVGKIRTGAPGGHGILTRQNLDHDQLTTEILAQPLAVVDRQIPKAGIFLRSIWTRQYDHARICTDARLAGEIVRAADRASARFGGGPIAGRSAGNRQSTRPRMY